MGPHIHNVCCSSTVDANVLTSGRLVQMLTTPVVLDNNTVRKEAGRKARDTSHEKETSSIRDCMFEFSNTQFFLHAYTTRHISYSLHHTVIPVF